MIKNSKPPSSTSLVYGQPYTPRTHVNLILFRIMLPLLFILRINLIFLMLEYHHAQCVSKS